MVTNLAAAAVLLCISLPPLVAEPPPAPQDAQETPAPEPGAAASTASPSAQHAPDDPDSEGDEIVVYLEIPDQTLKEAKQDDDPKVEQDKTDPKPAVTSKEKAQTQRRARLTREALSFRGTRYVWGGASRLGFDCSGFTQYLYARRGIELPHSAKVQFSLGTPVQRPELRDGDLVFFNTRGPISHVGMYIGHGKFVHAANPRRGVRVDSLDSPYYANRYAGARRYVNPDPPSIILF